MIRTRVISLHTCTRHCCASHRRLGQSNPFTVAYGENWCTCKDCTVCMQVVLCTCAFGGQRICVSASTVHVHVQCTVRQLCVCLNYHGVKTHQQPIAMSRLHVHANDIIRDTV